MATTASDIDPDIRRGSFADAAGADDDTADTQASEAAAAAEAKAASDKAAQDQRAAADEAARVTKVEPEKVTNPNPNLDDEPALPKTETKVDPKEDEVPHGMTGKAAETWKSLKNEKKDAIAALVPLQGELETLKKQLAEKEKGAPEIEALRKQNEDLTKKLQEFEGEIAITRVEATPKFKADVTAPMKSAEDIVKAIATKYELSSPIELLEALREPDENKRTDALSELAKDFKLGDSTRLFAAADSYARATKLGEDLRKDANASLEILTKEQKVQQERDQTQNIQSYRKAVDEKWNAIQQQIAILRPSQNTDERSVAWNNYLASKKAEVDARNVNDLPVDEVAAAMVSHAVLQDVAKTADHFRAQAKKEREARIAAEEKLEAFKGATPGAGGGNRGEPHGGNGTGAARSGSFVDAVAEE